MDDISGKINELLSDPASMERIKNLAGLLAGENSGEKSGGADVPAKNAHKSSAISPSQSDLPIDPSTIIKLKNAFSAIKKDDPRIDLLLALKSNLSVKRQKKIDDAIRIMRLLSIMPVLKEQGIFNDLFK